MNTAHQDDARRPRGLSTEQAEARLRRDGPNTLPQPGRRNGAAILLKVLREPMLLLLLGAAGVYLLVGSAREAMLLLASVLLVVALTLFQEYKAEHALQALRDLSSPRARVLRDGHARVIAARDVVVGDVLLVEEGDRLPADARVLEENDLHADESLLTGESVPVRRQVAADDDDAGRLHASTLVVRGHGLAEVVAVGAQTAVGRIGVALGDLRVESTPLQREVRRIVLLFAGLSLASCIAMVWLYVVLRGGWMDALLAGITLAMSNIPEEFPVVLTIFLALGAWRMAQHAALVRRIPAIEALGATTVLCTDKTGTLTENRMRVAEVAAGVDGNDGDAQALRVVLELGVLASPAVSHDPMELALREAAPAAPSRAGRLLREYGLTRECPAMANAWRDDAGGTLVACKGAPETVAGLCGLPATVRDSTMRQVDAMAARGLRVLAIASARNDGIHAGESLPPTLGGLRLGWNGLVGFADPLRAGVDDAVREARQAGIRVLMLTGDHIETARAIARTAGIARADEVVLGRDLGVLPPERLRTLLRTADVYARVRPEDKLRLVTALKQAGEVVAMTGDGVNDAPALMAAHVGIAMGGRGTDVAREAAAIVLLDDNFVTVVRAIRLGRIIYDNIRRAVRYIVAVHVPITGLALLPLLSGSPLVLLPVHVVFLELIIDPACSIVLEREPGSPDTMQRPPRAPGARMIDAVGLVASLAQGGIMFAAVLAVDVLARAGGLPPPQSGALAFTALVSGNIGLILLYRSGRTLGETLRLPNPAFWVVAVAALAMLAAIVWVQAAARWFGFAAPPLRWWLAALVVPLACATGMRALGQPMAAAWARWRATVDLRQH